MKKALWIKKFKYYAKQAGIKRRLLNYWADTCWLENTCGEMTVLTPKQSAYELYSWMNK